MSYKAPYLDDSGMHLPTYDEVMQYLVQGYKRIFGSDVYIGEDSQDYQLLSLYAKQWDDLSSAMLDTYNSRNIYWATGSQLDALISLNGLSRLNATASTVTLTCTGEAGRTLAKGSSARDDEGYSWITLEDGTFGTDGTVKIPAKCAQDGAVYAPKNTITTCQTPVYYWTAVTNDTPSVTGRDVQTDAQLRQRRALSVGVSGMSTLQSLTAALLQQSDILSVNVLQNDSNSTDANGIPAHSICCVVNGGTPQKIAQTIFLKRAPGIGTYGNKTVSYTDRYGHTNAIKYRQCELVTVSVTVTLTKLTGYDDDSTAKAIKDSIASYINSLGVGQSLPVTYLYAHAYTAIQGTPTFVVKSITAGAQGQTASSAQVTAAYYQQLHTSAASITIAEG